MSGVYIHIPFCVKKCRYCNFYSVADASKEPSFVDAVIQEIQLTDPGRNNSIDTIYFGGGTPSVISHSSINHILDVIYNHFDISPDAEITIEVNPGTLSGDTLSAYRKMGINRLNIGVQSFNNDQLCFLGRSHSAGEARFCIEEARKQAFNNIGLDLIYGLPGQSPEMWHDELNEALSFRPEHLSCYSLTYEPDTPLYSLLETGRIIPMDDAIAAEQFEHTILYLAEKGYTHYEISNFSSSLQTRSRHNMKYWESVSYFGFGPSAHSFDVATKKRSWNVSDLSSYIDRVSSLKKPVAEEEFLSQEQRLIEAVFLGFRKTEGIQIETFNHEFNIDFHDLLKGILPGFISSGHIICDDSACRLTLKGLLLADSIISQCVNEL